MCHGFMYKFLRPIADTRHICGLIRHDMVLISPLPTDDYARFHGEQTLRKINKDRLGCAQFRLELIFRGRLTWSVSIMMSKIAIGFAAAAIGMVGPTLSVSALQSRSMESSISKVSTSHR
jgi:hypothetical protein